MRDKNGKDIAVGQLADQMMRRLLDEAFNIIDGMHPARPRPMLPAEHEMYQVSLPSSKRHGWLREVGKLLDETRTEDEIAVVDDAAGEGKE